MRITSAAALALLLSSPARGDDRFDAHVALGTDADDKPRATFEQRGILLQGALTACGRVESASDVPVDRYGTAYDPGVAVSPMARVALRLDTRAVLKKVNLAAEYEHDLPTGTWSSGRGAVGHPDARPVGTELRKAPRWTPARVTGSCSAGARSSSASRPAC